MSDTITGGVRLEFHAFEAPTDARVVNAPGLKQDGIHGGPNFMKPITLDRLDRSTLDALVEDWMNRVYNAAGVPITERPALLPHSHH